MILYATMGLGHKFIAQNIGEHLKQNGYEVRLDDILQVQSGKLVSTSSVIYLWLLKKLPWLWKWIYTINLVNLLLPLRTIVAGRNSENAKKIVSEYDPDIILSTEVAASAVVAYLKKTGFYKKLFGITFSDFHLHRFWVHREADFYFVNIQEQKDELIKLGFHPEKILLNGIPLWPTPVDPQAVRAKLGIISRKVILVSAGSLGFGIDKKYVLNLLAEFEKNNLDFNMVLVCGKFKELFDELSTINDPRLKLFGFYSPMDELYAISDIFVGKPGGLSTTESIYRRLPIIITHWMPGGEDMNVEYLTKNRLVMPVTNPGSDRRDEITKEVVSELSSGSFRKVLENNSELISSIANTDPSRIGEFLKKLP